MAKTDATCSCSNYLSKLPMACFYRATHDATCMYSAVYAVARCLSQAGDLSKRLNGSSLFSAHILLILHCILRKFGYFLKIRVLPLGTLSLTLNLAVFLFSGYSTSTVAHVVNLVRSLQVCYTERPFLFTTHKP